MFKVMYEYNDGRKADCIENGKTIFFTTIEEANQYAENCNSTVANDLKEFFPIWYAIEL